MGKLLDKQKNDNFDKMKIGFLLELVFRQNSLNEQARSLISFLEDNQKFFTNIDICNITQGLDSFIELFYNFTGLIFKDVDFEETYCQYHKDFY